MATVVAAIGVGAVVNQVAISTFVCACVYMECCIGKIRGEELELRFEIQKVCDLDLVIFCCLILVVVFVI